MSIDHISISTPAAEYDKTLLFYENVLSTLGYKRLYTIDNKAAGFGHRYPAFWVGAANPSHNIILESRQHDRRSGNHIAFVAKSRTAVDEFYRVALINGAKDNGAPGFRPQYHRFYYGAFVIDADGNNIEAVNHFDWRTFIGWKSLATITTITALIVGVLITQQFT
ncbi:unnamed protein product [Didymodactylos carnosus]|uniref:VOC domain-containing protein n=1 Tax=Didymodactylos carnosus TaxID=1234261 RepID=A0A814GFE2_9BILA|nr:unnamed protein product [Didymodactylos carnosus]CAF0995628.1 unnamed protein product [Didymodactylos carnosus]CAF3558512.1 unnamed protein product [Didymodactylos carnosus]CAF3767277.1 unnamed protein product [Didymodactylos carnosus]